MSNNYSKNSKKKLHPEEGLFTLDVKTALVSIKSLEIQTIMNGSSEMNKKYKILLIGQPKVREKFLSTLCLKEDPNQNCLLSIGKVTLEITPTDEEMSNYSDTHGIITLFDHEDPDSFSDLPNTISDSIHIMGKMLPTVVVGLHLNETSVHEEKIRKEDVLEYLYTLGNTCACMIPYIEITDQISSGLVFVDLIKIIECSSIDSCFGIQAIRRGSCGIHQYQKLSVKTV